MRKALLFALIAAVTYTAANKFLGLVVTDNSLALTSFAAAFFSSLLGVTGTKYRLPGEVVFLIWLAAVVAAWLVFLFAANSLTSLTGVPTTAW